MSNSILTDAVVTNFPLIRLAKFLTVPSLLGNALPRLVFLCLLCTAVIADTPDARAQAFNGEQSYLQGPQQQQAFNQPQGNPGQYQGYLQQGQFPNRAVPGMFPGVAAGTLFTAKLEGEVNSGKAQVGTQVKAKLGAPLVAQGSAVIPAGSTLLGSVTQVTSAQNSNYQSPGSLEIQFRSVQTPDGRTLPICTEIKKATGNLASNGSSSMSSGRSMMMPGMAMSGLYGMGTMYAMSSMYSGGSTSSMAPMMAMMGAMTAVRMVGSMRMGSRRGPRASEAKISKGTQLQLMLSQPIMLAMPPAIQPAASIQQPPQYEAAGPITYTQPGYAPEQPVPGLVQ